MPDIREYADVLDLPQQQAWGRVAEIARSIGGVLMGGTAVAMHLRHRRSYDLDIFTRRRISPRAVAKRLAAAFDTADVQLADADMCRVDVQGVQVDVVRLSPHEEVGPGGIRVVAPPSTICGMPVGSLADLLASKLDVIRRRPELRDYIDLYAIDTLGGVSIEDGIDFYCTRYGHETLPGHFEQTVKLLRNAGRLRSDPRFEPLAQTALDHLRVRSDSVAEAALRRYQLDAGAQQPTAAPPSMRHTPQRLQTAPPPASQTPKRALPRCNKRMPIARRRCSRPKGHRGGCR